MSAPAMILAGGATQFIVQGLSGIALDVGVNVYTGDKITFGSLANSFMLGTFVPFPTPGANQFRRFASGMNVAGKARSIASKIRPRGGDMCFVAGTQIKTENGFKNIEDIKVGDKVWSKNDKTGETGFKPVLNLFRTKPTQLVHLTYRNKERTTHSSQRSKATSSDDDSDSEPEKLNKLSGTPTHPFWSIDRQKWIEMGNLVSGETLLLSDGNKAVVVSSTLENAAEGQYFNTFNFEVADWHTYFVAPKTSPPNAEAVWVHNTGELCDAGKLALVIRYSKLSMKDEVWADKFLDRVVKKEWIRNRSKPYQRS